MLKVNLNTNYSWANGNRVVEVHKTYKYDNGSKVHVVERRIEHVITLDTYNKNAKLEVQDKGLNVDKLS